MEVQDSSNIIKKKFKLFSSNLAIIDENNNEITYNDLNNYSNLFSNLFNYKSLVFLLCENKLGSIISYFSLITNHQVPLLLNSDIDTKMLVKLLVFYKPNFLIIPNDFHAFNDSFTRSFISDGSNEKAESIPPFFLSNVKCFSIIDAPIAILAIEVPIPKV